MELGTLELELGIRTWNLEFELETWNLDLGPWNLELGQSSIIFNNSKNLASSSQDLTHDISETARRDMKRESLNTPIQSPHFQSRSEILDHIERTYSPRWYDGSSESS